LAWFFTSFDSIGENAKLKSESAKDEPERGGSPSEPANSSSERAGSKPEGADSMSELADSQSELADSSPERRSSEPEFMRSCAAAIRHPPAWPQASPAFSGSRATLVAGTSTVLIEAHQLAPVNVTIVAFLAARRQPAEPALGLDAQGAAAQAKNGGHLAQRPLAHTALVVLQIADGLAREAGAGRQLPDGQAELFAAAADDGGQRFINEVKQAGRQREQGFCMHKPEGLNRTWHAAGKIQAAAARRRSPWIYGSKISTSPMPTTL
jgi:hypothetical protein